jgi:hypothetical protein
MSFPHPDELLYFYRVDSNIKEVEPITAELTLSQIGSFAIQCAGIAGRERRCQC